MYYLFVIFFFTDGNQVAQRYPEKMTYLECMSHARNQKDIDDQNGGQNEYGVYRVDYYCGNTESFVKTYL